MKKKIVFATTFCSLLIAGVCYKSATQNELLSLNDIEAHAGSWDEFWEELTAPEADEPEDCVEHACKFEWNLGFMSGSTDGVEETCDPTYKPGDCGLYCEICTAYPFVGGSSM